jgi:hypothetical protein
MIGVIEKGLVFFNIVIITANIRFCGSIKAKISPVATTQGNDFGLAYCFGDYGFKIFLN